MAKKTDPATGEKKKKKWPWIVGTLVVLGLMGSCLDTDNTETTATDTTTSETAVEEVEASSTHVDETTTPESVADETTEEETPEPAEPEMNVGEEFEAWYLSRYEPPTWDYICDSYGGWACNVRRFGDMGDDTIVIVTNLSKSNPEGRRLAENAVDAVKNLGELEPTIPQRVKDNVRFVQVWDLQGNVVANGWVEFTA